MAAIEARGYGLLASMGATPLSAVYTAGGGARNEKWAQMRQALLGVPVLPSPMVRHARVAALRVCC